MRFADTAPLGIDSRGPPVLVPTAQRSRLQGPPVREGGTTTLGTRENWGSGKNRLGQEIRPPLRAMLL